MFKQNIVGGPSIIFNRYYETGKTFTGNSPNKPCQKIIGYDANTLHLWAIGQKLGVRFPLVRQEENNLRRGFPQFAAGCCEWIDWLAHEHNIKIQSAFRGGEKKIGSYKISSFCQELNTVFEFYADYWHCHTTQFPDENTIQPTIKDKDGNPMSVRDIHAGDHQCVQYLQDQG